MSPRKGVRHKADDEYLRNTLGIPVTDEMKDKIQAACEREGVAISYWGRSAFKEKLDRDDGKR